MKHGVKAPDAIIAATAVIYRAVALHTFDPVLLSLSESPLIDGLKTSPPQSLDGQKLLGQT